jgi:hypothetical protein
LGAAAAVVPFLAALAGAATVERRIPAVIKFNRDVMPIVGNTCFKCHGPDPKANKANLRLDLPSNAYAMRTDKTGRKYAPIVPGHPELSEVWRRVSSADGGVVMPPRDTLHQLSARDKEILRRWIEQGAVYEKHWAYMPPKKDEPPAVASGTSNPIDRFIQKELAENGLTPSPEADRRTLVRRVYLDLVGLPPSPGETEAFVSDNEPDAYGRLVDRLLASPHFGERMAVEWLDLARFADTVGYHGDQLYNNFPYRDWVINAYNSNMPFDEFTREQLAGDLLPNATAEDRVASGFNRLNMVTREGGAQPMEYLDKYAADRVRTVSTTWLGSTMACCECHDHKFDPFKTKDFYSMEAYFADIKQWGVYNDYTYTPEPDLKGFNNDSPFPPEIQVLSPYLAARQKKEEALCRSEMEDMGRKIVADPVAREAADEWARSVSPFLKAEPTGWKAMTPREAKPRKDGEAGVSVLPDGSVRFLPAKGQKDDSYGNGALITYDAPAGVLARLRLEALPDDIRGGRVTSRPHDDEFTLAFNLKIRRAGSDKDEAVDVCDGYPGQPTWTYFNGQIMTSMPVNWVSAPSLASKAQHVDYILAIPATLKEGDKLVVSIESEDVARLRVSLSPIGLRTAAAEAPEKLDAAVLAGNRTPRQEEEVAEEYFAATRASHPYEFGVILDDTRQAAACRNGMAFTTVTVATTPRMTRILPRGNWQDDSGAVVVPATPAFLTVPAPTGGARQTRLDLANWIISRDNPLTARTIMNRLWKQFFGTGLSAVVDDLGTQGEYPTHPELLDWLAVEFMDKGWDMKAMVREIVMSGTYRQSSKYRPELADIDPDNRLVARQSPRRLEAEFIRDNALAAGGLINLDIGGPSIYPYQPAGYYVALQFPDRDYIADSGDRQYRRGVYVHWQRTFLHPMLANFDAPSREECTASRIVSSTPQQALTLLNDPEFVEAARGLAEKSLEASKAGAPEATIDAAFRRLLSRPPTADETASVRSFFEEQLAYYRGAPAEAGKLLAVGYHPVSAIVDAPTLAAWTSVARVLINLNEAIVRY